MTLRSRNNVMRSGKDTSTAKMETVCNVKPQLKNDTISSTSKLTTNATNKRKRDLTNRNPKQGASIETPSNTSHIAEEGTPLLKKRKCDSSCVTQNELDVDQLLSFAIESSVLNAENEVEPTPASERANHTNLDGIELDFMPFIDNETQNISKYKNKHINI